MIRVAIESFAASSVNTSKDELMHGVCDSTDCVIDSSLLSAVVSESQADVVRPVVLSLTDESGDCLVGLR